MTDVTSRLPIGAIIVMGVSGSGKSTLAQALALALGCPFIEGDSLHDARCVGKMSTGQPLTDEDRAPWLLRVGQALNDAVKQHGVAVATCSALRYSYRDALRGAVEGPIAFILLDAPHDELTARMAQRRGHFMPTSLLQSQLSSLERPRADERALTLDARQPLPQLCAAAFSWLRAA